MKRKTIGETTLFDPLYPDSDSLHELDDIKDLIDWKRLETLLQKGLSYANEGASPYPEIVMFKILLVQSWYNLSDVMMEKMLQRDLLFKNFCGFSLYDPTPDHSTLSRFRARLVEKNMHAPLLHEVNQQLQNHNVLIQQGSVSIVDATVIEAHQVRKKPGKNSDNTQDKEAGYSVKKGTKGRTECVYGFKAHTNVDEDGFVKKVIVTAGNVHDSQQLEPLIMGDEFELYADSAYQSSKTEALLASRGIVNKVTKRAYRNKPLTASQKLFNSLTSATRSVVERTFGSFKLHYRMAKTRFLGVARNQLWVTILCIAHNIKKAVRLLSCDVVTSA